MKWSLDFVFDESKANAISILRMAFSYPNFYVTYCKFVWLRCVQSQQTYIFSLCDLLIWYHGFFKSFLDLSLFLDDPNVVHHLCLYDHIWIQLSNYILFEGADLLKVLFMSSVIFAGFKLFKDKYKYLMTARISFFPFFSLFFSNLIYFCFF